MKNNSRQEVQSDDTYHKEKDKKSIDSLTEVQQRTHNLLDETVKDEALCEIFAHFQNEGVPLYTWNSLQESLKKKLLTDDYEATVQSIRKVKISLSENPPVQRTTVVQFLTEHFTQGILENALIDSILLRFDEVHVQVPEKNKWGIPKGAYYIPIEVFSPLIETSTQEDRALFSQWIYRGESYGTWFTGGYTDGKFFPMPIVIFNQEYDEINIGLQNGASLEQLGVGYLASIPIEKQRERYILGTIAHEIAHMLYAYFIADTNVEQEWKEVVWSTGNVSAYAKKYQKNARDFDFDENFAETIRLYTTVPGYLQAHYPAQYQFVKQNFPEILEI